MKISKFFILGVLAAFVLGSCDILTGKIDTAAEIQTTMNQFISGLNASDRSGLKNLVHPDSTNYASVGANYWDADFDTTKTFALNSLDAGNANNVTGSIGGFTGGAKNFTASFRQDGSRMKFMTLTLQGGLTVLP